MSILSASPAIKWREKPNLCLTGKKENLKAYAENVAFLSQQIKSAVNQMFK